MVSNFLSQDVFLVTRCSPIRDIQTALDAMAGYYYQVTPFKTLQEATGFLVDIFSTIIQSKYPAFSKTRDTSLIFELKGEGIPIPTPSPRLS